MLACTGSAFVTKKRYNEYVILFHFDYGWSDFFYIRIPVGYISIRYQVSGLVTKPDINGQFHIRTISNFNPYQYHTLIYIIVLNTILDGNSKIGAHMYTETGDLFKIV